MPSTPLVAVVHSSENYPLCRHQSKYRRRVRALRNSRSSRRHVWPIDRYPLELTQGTLPTGEFGKVGCIKIEEESVKTEKRSKQ